ncbi:unnamed protein product, partial [Mesorhabditis belari]|uniref:HYR domain-containing protein n=1 Tax=Mesorhabditis belari TaxID=2138241 RepID=A0AAF3FN77_9BILA
MPLFDGKILLTKEMERIKWKVTDLHQKSTECVMPILVKTRPESIEISCPDELNFPRLFQTQQLILPDFSMKNIKSHPENGSFIDTSIAHFIQIYDENSNQEIFCEFYVSFKENKCKRIPPNFVCTQKGNKTNCRQDSCGENQIWTHQISSISCDPLNEWIVNVNADQTSTIPKCQS